MHKKIIAKHLFSALALAFLIFIALGSNESDKTKTTKKQDYTKKETERSESKYVKKEEPQLTQAHREAIQKALKKFGFTGKYDVNISNTGYLVVTLHFSQRPLNPKAFGQSALIAIRNELYPTGDFDHYRVSLRGPSPGQGLVLPYGAARFIEGGKVTWSKDT